VREQVATNEFEQQAGSFFQNNNSILPSLLDYIKDAVGVKPSGSDPSKNKTYLVDAYCGSGLFAISLADQFDRIEGVEIDKASIKWAKKNADYNKGEGRGEIGFRDGKAEAIFGVRILLLFLVRSFEADPPRLLNDLVGHFFPS
jgi:tRNA (uracil-5-)-methyltransferase